MICYHYIQAVEEANEDDGKALSPCSERMSMEAAEDPGSRNEHIDSGRDDI